MNLSTHFTLEEFILSQTAVRHEIDNEPPLLALSNLKKLAETLEEVRNLFNAPILISSGYRCPILNNLVGGSRNSAHQFGRATDFTIPAFGPPLAVARKISESEIKFDQLINEFGRWVHLGIAENPRRELLTINKWGTILGLKEI